MLNYLDKLGIVGPVAIIIIAFVFLAEIIKSGKIIVEFIAGRVLKIQTKTAKKKEREEQLTELILKNNIDLQDFMSNQSSFNNEIKQELVSVKNDITSSMETVKSEISEIRTGFDALSNTVTDMQLESMRETILEFASALSSPNGNVYSKEQFNYVKKIYRQYTDLIKVTGKSNDEVDLSMIIINDKYEYNVLHHTFVEDLVKNPTVKHDIDEEMEKSKNRKSKSRKSTGTKTTKDKESNDSEE